MANNNIEQQIFDHLNKGNQVLIALPAHPNGDAVGAGLAMFDFLKKLEKQPEIVCAARDLAAFKFLPGSERIQKELAAVQSFVVAVNTEHTPLDELSYEVKDKRVEIFLKPKSGQYSETDVSFGSARFPYDLIITLDAPSLEHLGAVYENNTDLFFETPVINIDHHPGNEQYGEINLVDVTATATSEILAGLIENFEENLIDENIATNLLTGIVVETNSFQHVKTTPKAFLKASRLVSRGANQQQIIRELYKTKEISLLKLWGRALARLKAVPELSLTYTLLSQADLLKCEADQSDLPAVLKELTAALTESKLVLLLAETGEQTVAGRFSVHPTVRAQVLAAALGGQMINGSTGRFELPGRDLLAAEQEVLAKLQKIKEQAAL